MGKAEGAGPAFSEETYPGLPKIVNKAELWVSACFSWVVSKPL